MTVRKLTQREFQFRLRRIALAHAPRAHVGSRALPGTPLVQAGLGALTALPLLVAAGVPLPAPVTALLPGPAVTLALAAGLGAAPVLLAWHGVRLAMRRDRVQRSSAAFVTGALGCAALLLAHDSDPAHGLGAVQAGLSVASGLIADAATGLLAAAAPGD